MPVAFDRVLFALKWSGVAILLTFLTGNFVPGLLLLAAYAEPEMV